MTDENNVAVELTSQEWTDIMNLLLHLSTAGMVSLNNPERAIAIRDKIVKQLP